MIASQAATPRQSSVGFSEALEIAVEAYTYAYPLVLMDARRRIATNVAEADCELGRGAPINQFTHVRRLSADLSPPGVFADPDVLRSSLWFDVSREPLIVNVPDSEGRFYSLSLSDYWSEVFAAPGPRSTGAEAQLLAITGPSWQGSLPPGIRVYRCPTAIGRASIATRVNGAADLANAARFQAGLSASLWSEWGRLSRPVSRAKESSVSLSSPVDAVAALPSATYFGRFCCLTRYNPPHAHDYPVIDRILRIGLMPGRRLDLARLSPLAKLAIEDAASVAVPAFVDAYERALELDAGWRFMRRAQGVYGADYALRAGVAFAGPEALGSADCACLCASRDAADRPLDAAQRYVITFAPGQLPPARAFWSLSLYDEGQRVVPNLIGRHSLRSTDAMRPSEDGSIAIHVQRDPPSGDKEHNWLPAPKAGAFSLALRLYAATAALGEQAWHPPAIRRLEDHESAGRGRVILRNLGPWGGA